MSVINNKYKLAECLKSFSIKLTMDTFPERKKMQKLIYLMQVFGINLGFNYNWYLHGPYSPGLTKILFELTEFDIHGTEKQTKDDKLKIKRLKAFLREDINSNDRLELLVSIHYLKKIGAQNNLSDNEIILVLKEKKPYFSDTEINFCWNKVSKLDAG